MALLCFLLDLRSMPPPLLRDLKESLLRLANLYSVTRVGADKGRRPEEIPKLRDLIALCYIQGGGSHSSSPELKLAYRPGQSFSLRDFHQAVNNLPMNCMLPVESMPFGSGYQEVSLTNLLSSNALYTWDGDGITKKVIAISTTVFVNGEAFWKSLMDAAEHCVSVDFVVLEQEDAILHCGASEKLNVFANSLHDLENCVLHRYLPDSSVLSGLVSKWLNELRNDLEEPLQAAFLWRSSTLDSIKQISCNLSASYNQIIDGFTPCQACRCHGCPAKSETSNKTSGSLCALTRRELKASDLVETAVMIGEQTILFPPPLEGSLVLRRVSTLITFNVIERTNLVALDEGLILGTSYVVTPTCPEVDADSDECDKPALNAQIFHGLCKALFHLDQGLVCSSTCNTETMLNGAFPCFYLLQPSDRGLMLLRRLAGAEEISPYPNVGQLNGLVIPDEIKSTIDGALSMVELRDYNPLQHERGFHQKMNCLVKDSLPLGSIPRRTDLSPDRPHLLDKQVSNLQQQQSLLASVSEETHSNQNKDDCTSSCITEEWEQLLIVDGMNNFSLPPVTKPKTNSSMSTQSRPLDDKTSRILERLEPLKHLKAKAPLPSLAVGLQPKKPVVAFQPSSSQPLKPQFQKLKRKR